MGKTRRLGGMRAVAFCILLSCLILMFPQSVHAAPGDTAGLAVQQTCTRPAGSTVSGTFGYVLAAQNAANPMPGGGVGGAYSFSITDTGTFNIPAITYAAAGAYEYTLKPDTAALGSGFTRAAQEYTVVVYVLGTSPNLDTTVIVKNASGNKVGTINFTPSYQPLQTGAIAAPQVQKTVTGSPSSPGTFDFVLRALNPSSPMPAGSAGGTKTISISGSGAGDFGSWRYTRAGIYNYTVTESDTGITGYTYDGTVYSIRDVVTDNSGQLVLSSRTITSSSTGGSASVFAFTNNYTPAGGSGGTPAPAPPNPPASSNSPSRPAPRPGVVPGRPSNPVPGAVAGPSSDPASSSSVSASTPQSAVGPEPGEKAEAPVNEDIPLAGFVGARPDGSLLSLLMSITGAIISVVTAIVHIMSSRRKRETEDEGKREAKYRRLCNFLRVFSAPVGLLVGIVFLILDDLTWPMAFINRNTIFVTITFIVQLALVIVQGIVRRKKVRPENGEHGIDETA